MDFKDLLRFQVANKAPDSHLKVGELPFMRNKAGEVLSVDNYGAMSSEELEHIATEIMGQTRYDQFLDEKDYNGSYNLRGVSNFRVNACFEKEGLCIDFRAIPEQIPSFEEIGLPESVRKLLESTSGLILVTAPNGQGKSTTLASLVDYLNENKRYHILTIEDPIEFVYKRKKSFVTQREIGLHTKDFQNSLKNAGRQDVNVIVLGALPDRETIENALTLAETGYLVLATMLTKTATQTIEHIVNSFPGSKQALVRTQLAGTLRGVIAQQLVALKEGQGRVAVREIMLMNETLAELIRKGETGQINAQIEQGQLVGMLTFDDSLLALLQQGLITVEQVLARANDVERVQHKIKSLK